MRHDKLYGLELTVSSYYVAALLFTGILYSCTETAILSFISALSLTGVGSSTPVLAGIWFYCLEHWNQYWLIHTLADGINTLSNTLDQ
ncbi:hypothetical protein EB796_018262 [Bugula neritina]|uniref:Uncharacterized protein n=1 Tax=Bugula neritina TaxID=10212 RepID=A0A7J7JBV7_BUGNE|nr:hypothetical protein EB796_018262 [Bugula neritina]